MAKIIWTNFAIEDLKSIHDYISRDSKSYANKFIDKLITRVEQLETFPQSGKVVSEFGKENIRELVEGSSDNLQDKVRSHRDSTSPSLGSITKSAIAFTSTYNYLNSIRISELS